MIKQRDVAALAGVSVSTVSRVLNKCDKVDPETRRAVEAAIKELDYRPDEIARRLKRKKSEVLGVIVPDISNPYFAAVVRGIEFACMKADYSVVLCDTDGDRHAEERSVDVLSAQKVAGIISASAAADTDSKAIYEGLRVVFFDNIPSWAEHFSAVTIDNRKAAQELTELMLDRGHEDICTIAGPATESSARERLLGFKDALRMHGMEDISSRVLFGDNKPASGEACMAEFLKRSHSPGAVFAANNFMAYGAVKALHEHGLRFPEDIEIATFDITDETGLIKPKFTSVSQPAFEIGRMAAEVCIRESGCETFSECSKIIMKHTIE